MKKKKLIIFISIIFTTLLLGGGFVFAYFGYFYKLQGSEIIMENVKFTVNDNPNKSEENSIYLSNEDICKTDGYQIVLNYSLNGSFVSNYAMQYHTYFQLEEDNTSIATALDLYRFDNGLYKYMGKLSDLAPYILNEEEATPIYSSYLGAMGTHTEKFMLVYPMGSTLNSKTSLKIKISTESKITLTDSNEFPFYYLNDIGVTDENSGSGRKAENLFISLSENNEEALAAKGRTIVLMRDIEYSSVTNITFNDLVGLDLNGYQLDLKGGKITFTDTANQNDNEYIHPNCQFTDSKGTGSINGSIELNYNKSLVDIDDSFIDAINRGNSTLTITNASEKAFKAILDENLNELAKTKHLTNEGTYKIDVFGNLKNYISKFNVSFTSSKLHESTTILPENGLFSSPYLINVSGISEAESIDLIFNFNTLSSHAIIELYGTSTFDCSEYLKSYLPKTIDGSIYLPTYIESFNSYITWVTSNEEILSSNGELLKNGYKNLDNWYKYNINIGYIIDQNGSVLNGIIKDIDVVILTEEERVNLIFSGAGIIFASETADTNKYSFSFIDLLAEKYLAYRDIDDALISTEPINLEIIANEFNVILDNNLSYEERINSLISNIKTKLGLEDIPYIVEAIEESIFAVNDVVDENIVSVTQNGTPSTLVVLPYKITFNFNNGTNDITNIEKTKIISINASTQVVSFVDLSNTLRVPFDTYTKYMTEYSILTNNALDYNVYNPYINNFELVSTFNNTAINYIVPDEYKDYVSIKEYSNGVKVLEIAKDNVPADTHTVTIIANIEGVEDKIYLPFTCVGVLHNASSLKHAEFEDGKLYIELLNYYDTNSDQVLTDLEAKTSPITSLSVNKKKINSLVGLRYFENLVSINFNENDIVNISDLAYLKNLEVIDIGKNKIANLEPLRYLDNLTHLYANENQIASLEPIQYLTNLSRLRLNSNYITDFQYVQNLTNLKELNVAGNKNSSGYYTVCLEKYAEGLGSYVYTVRSNQYYFNLLAQKRGSNEFTIITNDSTNAQDTISSNAKNEALYLSTIEPIFKTSDTISLPTYYYADGTSYPITYSVTDEYKEFVNFTKIESGSDLGKITNITLKQLPVDKEVTIYANIIGLAENQELFYRPIKLFIRKTNSDSRLFGSIEVLPNYWVMGTDLVKDSVLLSELWAIYDADGDGKITNTELNPSSEVSLNLEDMGVTSLSGIQYFKNITYLNLRNNELELKEGTEFANITYLAYLDNLKTLYINNQYFDFDDLLNYTRLKENSTYANTRSESLIVQNAILVDSTHLGDDENNLFDKEIIVDFDKVGLTSLIKFNTNGSKGLADFDILTKLYHVYLVNSGITIYKNIATVGWNPIEEEINRLIGSLTTSAKFINYNDKVEIKKNYEFYLYDDLYPTTFSLSYKAIDDNQYVYSAVPDENYGPTTNNTYKNVYQTDGTLYELSPIDSSFIEKTNHKLNSYFSITTDTENINIQYKKLTYRDYQAYVQMTLSTGSLSNGRRNYSGSTTYYLALFMQYNNDYIFVDDNNIDLTDDNKPLNAVFGSTEAMLYVMNGLSEKLRTNTKNYYYTVTKNDGTVEKYYYNYQTSSSNLYTVDTEVVDTDWYKVTSSEIALYDGSFNGGSGFDSSKYFFIAGNFMPTASSAVDGLRFLPQITKVYFKTDAMLGTGKDLINLEELFVSYSYFDMKDFDTVLDKMKYLTISQSAATNLSNEKNTDSNPNNLIESYLVYMPNLIQFHFSGEGLEEKGQMYEWSAFLAYSYIPYSQISNDRYYDSATDTVGGIELDANGYYYWYDASDTEFDNFKYIYCYYNDGYNILTQDYIAEHKDYVFEKNDDGVYAHLYTDFLGHHLSENNNIFRKVKEGTVKLNNFKLSRGSSTYDSGKNKYSNTYENQVVLIELYKNIPLVQPGNNKPETHYYIATEPHVDNGDSYDFDPDFSPITFATTLEDEYNEIAPTVADLHLTLYGTKFDGTDLWDDGLGTEYSAIDWTDTDYSDYFRQGLMVRLPLTFNDFKTGNTEYDNKYRTFTITWYVTYVAYVSSSYVEQYETLRIGYASFNGTEVTYHYDTDNLNTNVFSKYYYADAEWIWEGNLMLILNNPGYYLFEGLLELSDGTKPYSYNTKYDARQASMIDENGSYTYTNDITGSVSILYPISITSLSDSTISSDSNIQSRIKSITKIAVNKRAYRLGTYRWFDTIVDRSFKFAVFSNFASKGIHQTDTNYEINIGTYDNNKNNPFAEDNRSRMRLYDKLLYTSYGLKPYNNLVFSSDNIDKGLDIEDKSAFAVKTFAGLERFLSDIYTLDGWETLKMSGFYYRYAGALTSLPVNFPTSLKSILISSTYGLTYYGGLFYSKVENANLSYYSCKTADVGNELKNYSNLNYQNDNIFDIYDYPDLVDDVSYYASRSRKMTLSINTLVVNSISEGSFEVLGKLSNVLNNKLTIYLKPGNLDNYLYNFTDYDTISAFYNEVDTDKLDIIIDASYNESSGTFSGGYSLINDALKYLISDYDKVTSTNELTDTHWYETTEALSNNVSVVVSTKSTAFYDNVDIADNPDFYPNLTLGKNITYNVAIRIKLGGNDGRKVQILKELKSSQKSVDDLTSYTVQIATFKDSSGNPTVKTGTSISYTASDLNFYDISYFDINFVKFLLHMTRTYNKDRYANQVTINGGTKIAVKGTQLFKHYNFSTNQFEDYVAKEDNSTDVQHIDGYPYILDMDIKINDKIYVIIVNTEYFSLDLYGDSNYTGSKTESYTTLDVKGFELLPIKAVVQGNGVQSKGAPNYVNKIINSSSSLNSGYSPKIQYVEINNEMFNEALGVNSSGSETYISMYTTIINVDNLAMSLADGATIVLGNRCKILQRFLQYDTTNGITLINDQSKTIYVKLDYSKMHLLFNNYASTFNAARYKFDFDTAYDTSFNYQRLKEEILNATMGEDTVFFKNYHDFYTPMYYKLVNFAGGELTNITMHNNLMNHPFYSEQRGVLGDDSSYNYYISTTSSNNALILYSGAKYDANKLFGTILNVHSNNIRKLSNNKNISMYYEYNSSDNLEEFGDDYVYSLSDSVPLRLPKTVDGTNVIYLPIDTYYLTSEFKYWNGSSFKFKNNGQTMNGWLYFDQNYGFSVPKDSYNTTFDIFVIKEYATYYEISLKENHTYYTAMRYSFAAFEYYGTPNSSSNPITYTNISDIFKNKTKYGQAANYDYAFNDNKGEAFIKKIFYVDINTNPAIGRQVIKEDDPLYLPYSLKLVGDKYNLAYTISSEYQEYLELQTIEVALDPLFPDNKTTFYKLVLTEKALNEKINAKNVKINVKVEGTYYTYTTGPTIGGSNVTTYISGQQYVYYNPSTGKWYGPLTTQQQFNSARAQGYIIRVYNAEGKIPVEHTFNYTEFNFFVDLYAGKASPNTTYPLQTSDFYVEVLVDTRTNEVVPGTLVEEYLAGEDSAYYEYQIRRADTIFESGLLLSDIYYNGSIALGTDTFTRHDTVTTGLNVDYFPKYAVIDINETAENEYNYNSIFVKEDGNIKTYARDAVTYTAVDGLTVGTSLVKGYYTKSGNNYILVTSSTETAKSGTIYYNKTITAEEYVKANNNYKLVLLLTKEQIANIHYFSSTNINFSNNVEFSPQSSLNGIEIFPLTNIRLGFEKDYGHSYNNSSNNSRAFSGNIFKSLKDMKLERFELVYKYTTIYINDWTFLFNSRDTLTSFIYGGIYTGQGETYGTTHDDFSFLLSFDKLDNVRIFGFTGIENTQSFKYLASTLYLKFGKNILTYYQNNNSSTGTNPNAEIVRYTSSDIAVAIPILYKFHTDESVIDGDLFDNSDFNYQNNYELYVGNGESIYSSIKNYDDSTEETKLATQYLLPSFINDSGTYYKLTYDSLSNFMDVVAININVDDVDNYGKEYTMLQYQELYAQFVFDCLQNDIEVNDYDFVKNYRIYARFKNLNNCLTDRIMISAKIECNSKMEAKDEIIEIDNSSDLAKTNYMHGVGYADDYFDGKSYVYTPYVYERYLSIYINHLDDSYNV